MTVRYMCTVHPHEREFLIPPARTPICCGKPMKRMDVEEAAAGEEATENPDQEA